MNRRIIAAVLGILLLVLAALGVTPLLIAHAFDEPTAPWWVMIACSVLLGMVLVVLGRGSQADDLGIKEGMAITNLTWVLVSLVAAVGIWQAVPGTRFMQAWFEAMSGLTTTGSTIFGGWVDDAGVSRGTTIAALPQAVLWWRALCHWMGGIGIVVISLALLPLVMGGGGFQMYRAEVPGVTTDRLAPRIANTARILLAFYCALTLAVVVGLWLCGASWFDAACHAFATVSTGGFSTFDNSITGFTSVAAEWLIIVAMIAAGINFSLLIAAVRGRFLRLLGNIETRVFLGGIFVAWGLVMMSVGLFDPQELYQGREGDLLRDTLFQVVSLSTSTGFGTGYDTVALGWDGWPDFARAVLLACMIVGGCAGSTAGGLKVIRAVIAWKATRRELRRFMEPARVTPVALNDHPIPDRTILQVAAFIGIFALTWLLGGLALSACGHTLDVAFSASLSAISNIGPGIGAIGSSRNYGFFSDPSLAVSILLMLLGRLEFLGVLITLVPRHWRK